VSSVTPIPIPSLAAVDSPAMVTAEVDVDVGEAVVNEEDADPVAVPVKGICPLVYFT
jgi:hypothetical protein